MGLGQGNTVNIIALNRIVIEVPNTAQCAVVTVIGVLISKREL